jgi:hypothetical protein
VGGSIHEEPLDIHGEDVIYKGIILGLTVLVGVGLILKYTFTTPEPHVRQFNVKECFSFDKGLDKRVSGIVEAFTEHEYLVLWTKEAEQRYAGPKIGAHVSIKWMDEYGYRVMCPKGWRKS